VSKEVLEKEILGRLKKYLPELEVGREAKVVGRKYLKYKAGKHWSKAPITNFDKERISSLNTLRTVLENLFEEVTFAPMKVPLVCAKDGILQMLPKSFEDKVLMARRLKPIFESRYRGVDYESSLVAGIYLGRGYTFYYYQDDNTTNVKAIDKLVEDVKRLHVFSCLEKLDKEKINNLIVEYYSDVFPKAVQVPVEPKEVKKVEELPRAEKPVETPTYEERKVKKRIRKKVERPVELFSADYEKVNSEEVQKVISEYKPEPTNFFGVVAKTKYDSLLKQVKDEEKRRNADFLFYQFIKLTGDTATKEVYTQFNKKLSELLTQTT
jgi:hypothetical protein